MKTVNNTRERLVLTAMDLIWKSSYGSVSVDDICKASDVKKGSFYHFFPSKIDLAVAAMDEAFLNFRPMMDAAFSPVNSPIERFELYIQMGYTKQKEITAQYGMVCGCPFMSLASEMAPQNEAIRAKTIEIIGHHKKYYETALRDMIADGSLDKDADVEATADQIFAFVMGQLVMARVQNSLDPIDRDLRAGLFRLMNIQNHEKEAA